VFGHGSSIDELREDAKAQPWEDPKEFLADTFAGFILMPIIGLRRVFSVRSWNPETATPALAMGVIPPALVFLTFRVAAVLADV
jgi:predicted Na+-dependent transporter